MSSVLTIERNREGVYFVEYNKTREIKRCGSPREVRWIIRSIPNGRLVKMAINLPVFSGFENHRDIETSFRALYNVRVREALKDLDPKEARTRVPQGYEYSYL